MVPGPGTATRRSRSARPASRPSGPAPRCRSACSPGRVADAVEELTGGIRLPISRRPDHASGSRERLRAWTGGRQPMKLALDPQMFFSTSSVFELPDIVAGLGYDWMELSPKADFIPFFKYPRVDDAGVQEAEEDRLRRRRGHRLGAPGAALVGAGRGPAAGGGPVLEAADPDHRRSRRRGDQHRVQRSTGGAGDRGGPVPEVDGRAVADPRVRGPAVDHRAASGRLHRGRPGGAEPDPRPQRRTGSASCTAPRTPSTRATTRRRSSRPAARRSATCTWPTPGTT